VTCGCWKCLDGRPCIKTVQIAASATPTRNPGAANAKKDKKLSKDLAAYKRMRDAGAQPIRVDGSAQIETLAHNAHEINTGTVWANEKDAARAERLHQEMA
jgi:hypothetical protein